ncbi:cyclic nucleotide-binding domain-containing protein [bacterium]|nr:cyclic nucleotide-binding domain-containing protein [bacterium]
MNEVLHGAYNDTTANFQWLKDTYFCNPSRRLHLKKGDVLLREGDHNERLFLVISGALRGSTKDDKGNSFEILRASKNAFVGGPSYFSKSYISLSTVIAENDCEVAYIDSSQTAVFDGRTDSLAEQFLPHMMLELIHRQQRVHRIALENERVLRALVRSEKMVSMGKIAAWIAHELNNAVAVLKRNCDWLGPNLAEIFKRDAQEPYSFFETGWREGRRLSSREARLRTKELKASYRLSDVDAQRLAQTGMDDAALAQYKKQIEKQAGNLAHYWEIGATLNDMKSAGEHAIHVVKSVRELGAQNSERAPGLFVDDCIREAVTLMASPLRKVNVELNLGAPKPIVGNKGEIVQILINLLQNACESVFMAKTPNPAIVINSKCGETETKISITDNGPGIPADILPHIFQPHLTTKTDGQSTGLGLGLMIVERIIDSYGGKIEVKSKPGETVFQLQVPRGGENV